jgi:uncharacterized membrane protein YjjP (DUF1212 family)
MTVEAPLLSSSESAAVRTDAALRFLRLSARLLLEYDVRTELLKRSLERVAAHLDVDLRVVVAYREVTLIVADGRSFHVPVPGLRLNAAITVEVLRVIDELCTGRLALDDAMRRLEMVERTAPRYGGWAVAAIFGMAAAALAWLSGADRGAMAAAGVASGLGVIARRELARRDAALLTQPFAAGLIGAALGGIVIRLGWTDTAGPCVIVPALMLVPGPHLINSVYDMLENHMETGICRLALAMNVLVAAALGVVVGVWLTLGLVAGAASSSDAAPLSLLLDITLAGLAACGFAVFYNAPWRVLWVSILCGMAGHGVRYLCLAGGLGVEMATLFGCVPVGIIGNVAARYLRLPFSSVAFAGAVPMMPGVAIYQSIVGAIRLSVAGTAADSLLASTTVALSFRAVFVVGSLAVGLLIGAATARLAFGTLTATGFRRSVSNGPTAPPWTTASNPEGRRHP